ncbi:MAG: signal peptidase I [Lachnospiraceae bacterium]|nr:signal peptidase I [Lachnospiraceae bacterium]
MTKKKHSKSGVRGLLKFSAYLLVILFLTFLLRRYVFFRSVVDGSSMESTLFDGDSLIVDELTYRLRDPKRFEVIVFPYRSSRRYYIKRVIGLPGESVRILDGRIYINGIELEENYGSEEFFSGGIAENDLILGEDEYFVLGDNRNDSVDSRSSDLGAVHRKEIEGKAFLRVYPFGSFGAVR